LPRSIGFTGKGWLVLLGALLLWIIVVLQAGWARRVTDQVDALVLRIIADVRTDWLTDVMNAVNRVGSGWAMSAAAICLVVALMVLKRWRHLFTFLASVIVLELVGGLIIDRFARPRPYDVSTIGRWVGYSLPSAAVAVVAIITVAAVYTLVVAGRPRLIAKWLAAVVVGVFAFARLYLGVDHPFDVLVGVALAIAIPVNAFRFFTPNEVFPVTYGGGKTAHLDIGGRRGEAIRDALHDQLGVSVLDIRPVGLAGSGGSTPLRIRAAGDPDTYLFGKLYAMNHVRADRWYKLGRTILYGRLEDEAPFQSVRRLVQYEDYALRLMRDMGIPTAAPFGIVELTPEREYLLVTQFFDGAVEVGEAAVDDAVIDQGLGLVRQLWDAGLAHRDIKPANLMVKDGRLVLIDVAFMQVRPSPWRQAVDLANMMLVLAVRTDAERVYQRALRLFTADEVAEAFAAARGIASPTQLRTVMKRDGRDLVGQFRSLAPPRRPISLQRWNPKRILLALALVVGAAVAVPAMVSLFTPANLAIEDTPSCGTGNLTVLMAQSVPSATVVPCIATLPAGWDAGTVDVRRDRSRFWLDIGHEHAVRVTLAPREQCVVADAVEVPSDRVGMRRFERPEQLPPGLRTTRLYVFDGGCVTFEFSLNDADASLMFDADSALGFQPRASLVDWVHQRSGLTLCGAGVPPCAGES
jgi:membrane-associated phospholipid phosphatase/tRNA A-37 threonylcarbamoyl transferase component Bud32